MEKFHSISDRFAAVRASLGWTQDRMARELLIDRAYLSQIENGRREPSARLVDKLSTLENPQTAAGPHRPRPVRYEVGGTLSTPIREVDGPDTVEEIIDAMEDLCGKYRESSTNRKPTILVQIKLVAAELLRIIS